MGWQLQTRRENLPSSKLTRQPQVEASAATRLKAQHTLLELRLLAASKRVNWSTEVV